MQSLVAQSKQYNSFFHTNTADFGGTDMDLDFPSAKKHLLFVIAIITLLLTKNAAAGSYLRNETDRLALLNIKLQITDDPEGVLKSWNHSHHHCHWEGVTCDVRHGRVIELSLIGKNLLGSISPYIGNISFLNSIVLKGNKLHGEIPPEIGRLFRLKNLNLSFNTLSGEIPVNLSQCFQLRSLSLFTNTLVGKIPKELGSLNKLEHLRLSQNNLTRDIPSALGNLSSLRTLSVALNNLDGSLPNEIGSLRNLQKLRVVQNKLSGAIPPSIYNVSTLSLFSITENFFKGKLPNDIGLKMPNLQFLHCGRNQLYGNIPDSITNATNLEELELSENYFHGQVQTNLGNLPRLRWLTMEQNLLGSNASGDLQFITSMTNCSALEVLGLGYNYFGGELPHSIGNLSLKLQKMYMGGNKISGVIPLSLMRLTNLYVLGMESNFFTFTIPRDLGRLQNLQGLNLNSNMLIGEIPSTFCNLTSLFKLRIDNNNLEGTIPLCFQNLRSLTLVGVSENKLSGRISPSLFANSFAPILLDLSHNSFHGSLPPELGRLANIVILDVSYNNFSGSIPETIGDFSNLQYLGMQCNFFQGTIPSKFGSMKAIEHMDLSKNNLTGGIPKDLESLPSMNYLNFSFNSLEGEVPRNGVFGNSSQVMLVGNSKLCGGIPELQLPLCPIFNSHKKKNWRLSIIIISIVSSATFLILSPTMLYSYGRRWWKNDSSPAPSREDELLRISFHELHRATGGFSQENIVGYGNFGVVYKGKLDQQNGKLVAVKVLDLQKHGVSKSFKAECHALRNIRHRNLVSILSVCSSIDSKGLEFKALVYDFMENGSLDNWLHPQADNGIGQRNLNLLQRMNIAIDVASALEYLHNYGGSVIAHCDLKPSNILLDNNLTAHLGDFGLARLVPKTTPTSLGDGTSNSVAIRGTVGYAAPEYAMGREASCQGDVYSYGILLLEMFTGKRPTNESFIDDLNLHNYVKKNLPEQVIEILDPLLQGERKQEMISCIISIFTIGLECSETSPNDRMDMGKVTRQLLLIKSAFLQ